MVTTGLGQLVLGLFVVGLAAKRAVAASPLLSVGSDQRVRGRRRILIRRALPTPDSGPVTHPGTHHAHEGHRDRISVALLSRSFALLKLMR